MRSTLALLLFASLSGLAACSGDAADTTPAATPGASAGKKVDAATAGSITGRVQFEGTVPPAGMIHMSSDRNCVPDGQPSRPSDALLVDDGRGVGNTFVYVKEGLDPSYTFDAPTAPVVLDQKGCYYTPRVIGVRVGQPMDILNSDPTLHNVHALPMVNQEFNHTQPKQNMRTDQGVHGAGSHGAFQVRRPRLDGRVCRRDGAPVFRRDGRLRRVHHSESAARHVHA